MNKPPLPSTGLLILIIVTTAIVAVTSFMFGFFMGQMSVPANSGMQLPTHTIIRSPTPSPSPTATYSPAYLATYEAINVNPYPTFTVYWKRSLWQSAVGKPVTTEDFGREDNYLDTLRYPYLSGNGFLINGKDSTKSPAMFIPSNKQNPNSGEKSYNLHFRDWGDGVSFTFPNNIPADSFGFDYTTSMEAWNLRFNDATITLSPEHVGFIGIIIPKGYPEQFNLSSSENAQGGISIANISYGSAGTH